MLQMTKNATLDEMGMGKTSQMKGDLLKSYQFYTSHLSTHTGRRVLNKDSTLQQDEVQEIRQEAGWERQLWRHLFVRNVLGERPAADLPVSSPTCCQKELYGSRGARSQVLLTGGGPGARSRGPTWGCPGHSPSSSEALNTGGGDLSHMAVSSQ